MSTPAGKLASGDIEGATTQIESGLKEQFQGEPNVGDWIPSSALGHGISSVLGFTKGQKIFRGIEKGTEDLAYKFPREVGAHFIDNKETATKFSEYYKGGGEVLEKNSKVSKPFYTEERERAQAWFPNITAENILERGKSNLSSKSKTSIKSISDEYNSELGKLWDKVGDDAWKYAEEKDNLSILYNKKIVEILEEEGYDHISYPLNTEEAAKGMRGTEAGIIFNKTDVENVK